MNQAELILFIVKAWALIGALVAVPFLTFGIDQLDEDARGAYVFRPLLIPGIIVIWPFVLWRWYIMASGNEDWSRRYHPRRASHQWVALIMPIAIVVIITVGLSIRQSWPDDIAPIQLTTPEAVSQ